MAKNYKWTLRFTILTPIFIFISFLTMAGGHGYYTPSFVLFPFATINITWQDQFSLPFMIAGLFQFPMYGFVIDKSKGSKYRDAILAGLFILHITLVILILLLDDPHWR